MLLPLILSPAICPLATKVTPFLSVLEPARGALVRGADLTYNKGTVTVTVRGYLGLGAGGLKVANQVAGGIN